MPSLSVIENLNVFKEILRCFLLILIVLVVNPLALEGMKKTLGDRIVPAVSLSTHAAEKLVFFQEVLPRMAGVLLSAGRFFGLQYKISWVGSPI